MPERLATKILVEGDADRFCASLPDDVRMLATFDDGDDRHLVFAWRDVRLRVCVTAAPNRLETAFVVPRDRTAATRLDAARQLCALQSGHTKAFTRPPFAPTPYHRARLAQLLVVADAIDAGATAHDIAFGIVFPNSDPTFGREWRDTSVQRQTRRLIGDAARMIDGGFWRLPCFV